MIVNASPLILFGKIQKINILNQLYGIIYITQSVYDEVVKKGLSKNASDALIVEEHIKKEDIKIKKLTNEGIEKSSFLQGINPQINKGEADTIALALQEKEKVFVIDEKKAREVAKLQGLKPKGSLRVILEAYQKNILNEKEIKEILTQMTATKFRVSAEIINMFWQAFDKLKEK